MRRIINGFVGLAIGAIFFVYMSTGMPLIETVNSSKSDFHIIDKEYKDDLSKVTGAASTIFPYGVYHLLPSDYDRYKSLEIAKYGKHNPMFYYQPGAANSSDDEGKSDVDKASQGPSPMTVEQEQAVKKAEQYLESSPFSKKGLIKQLEYEGFSEEVAKFAANRMNVDWNEQAVKKAQDYLEFSSFSRDSLKEQLLYEGFTEEQAEYGTQSVYGDSQGGKRKVKGNTFNNVNYKVVTGFNVETNQYEDVNVSLQLLNFTSDGMLPIDYKYFAITSEFGEREDPFDGSDAIHTGIDISKDGILNADVYSASNGIVEYVEKSTSGYGNHIIVNHGAYKTLYGHLSSIVDIEIGDLVSAGTVLGSVGSTGRSTGPHLHFEIRVDDVAVDPLLFIERLELTE